MAQRGTPYALYAPLVPQDPAGVINWLGYGALLALGIAFFAYWGIGAGMGMYAYINFDPTKCRTLPPGRETRIREIFVFGNSIDDMGNWLAYLNGSSGYSINGTRIINPGVFEYFVPPAGPNKFAVNYINPLGRFGQNWNGMDYVAARYGLYSKGSPHASNTLKDFDNLGQDFLVNFAIGGATANGNVYNAINLPLPHNYTVVIGSHGYDFQVNEFARKLSVSDEYKIKPNTWFFYNYVGADDIPLIVNCTNGTVANCSNLFLDAHLNNLQILYDLGMRNLIITFFDFSFRWIPQIWKSDPSENYINDVMDQLAGQLFASFTNDLAAQIAATMPLLNIINQPLVSVLQAVTNDNGFNEGIRPVMPQDPAPFPDPIFPFPTLLDYQILYGAGSTNTYYYDDNQLTEAGSRWYAQTFIRFLDSQFHMCGGQTDFGKVTFNIEI